MRKHKYFTVCVRDIPAELKQEDAGHQENTLAIIEYLEETYDAEFVQALPNLAYCIMRKKLEE